MLDRGVVEGGVDGDGFGLGVQVSGGRGGAGGRGGCEGGGDEVVGWAWSGRVGGIGVVQVGPSFEVC